MRPIVPITIAFAAGAIGASYLPAAAQPWTWVGLGSAYLGLCVWGTVSLRSGLFGRAWTRGDASEGGVALTYDDGPDPQATPALLDLLQERGVSATFFCVGERARAAPELVLRLRDEGHLIGNHSDRHSPWTNFYPAGQLQRELGSCQQTLTSLTERAPRYYRPPMGLINHAVEPVTRALDLELVGWQVRGLDTTQRSVEAVVERVLDRVQPGGIVLLHDGGQDPERVVAITRGVLDGLATRGLTPVRLDRLLASTSQTGPPPAARE